MRESLVETGESRGRARRLHRWWPVATLAIGVAIATAMCLLRLAWIGLSFGSGGSKVVSITIERGNVEYRVNGSVQPTGRTHWVFNRQVELGFQPRLHWDWTAGSTRVEAPVSLACMAVAAVGAGALLVRRMRRGPRRGHCACGYSLEGLERRVCPECGVEVRSDQRRV